MADITRAGVSLATLNPPPNCQKTLPAAAALVAGDYVYINSSGQFAKTNGTADNALARRWGMVNRAAASGSPVTAYHSVEFNYATGLTPGATLYLSAATAGALADAATTGDAAGSAKVTSATTIFVGPPRL